MQCGAVVPLGRSDCSGRAKLGRAPAPKPCSLRQLLLLLRALQGGFLFYRPPLLGICNAHRCFTFTTAAAATANATATGS